jgi:hypothetical protein
MTAIVNCLVTECYKRIDEQKRDLANLKAKSCHPYITANSIFYCNHLIARYSRLVNYLQNRK